MTLRLLSVLLVALAGMALPTSMLPAPVAAQVGPGPQGRAPYSAHPRNEAGRFDYYTLALSWSPTHCASLPRNSYDPQCHSADGRRYAFVLHGLWPQYERGWPEDCPTRTRPFVPDRVIANMLDIMPSRRLVIHQYRKHGTCSGLSPEDYFAASRRLFEKIRVPPRFVRPNQAFTVSPEEVVKEFLAVNPDLRPEHIAVACSSRAGNRLREVRVCFSREGAFRSCGPNENPRRLCNASRLQVPPVRGGGAAPSPRLEERRI